MSRSDLTTALGVIGFVLLVGGAAFDSGYTSAVGAFLLVIAGLRALESYGKHQD
jgi:hypothetical protein